MPLREYRGIQMSDLDTLDITDFKESRDLLPVAIANAVQDTQRLITRQLPNKLIMRKDQYEMLEHDSDMLGLPGSPKDRIYLTPYNAMDVVIK